jgi:DNA-binding transcriptional LysR family regulator
VERRQLEVFLAVADAGSFTRAAGRLMIAQPSLSYAIRTLEDEVGAPLFERHGRGARLTAAGEALVSPARRTLGSFSAAARAVRAVSDAGFGQVTIVASTLWAVDPLVELVGRLRRLHPAVQVVVRDPFTRADVLEQVRTGDVDFGILEGAAPGGQLESQWLADQELVALLPPGHPVPDRATGIADLAALGFICTPEGTALRTLLDDRLDAAALPREVAVETAHGASVVPLVLQGAGAALLPSGLAPAAAARGALVLPLAATAPITVRLLWRRGRLDRPAQHLLELAREYAEDRAAAV